MGSSGVSSGGGDNVAGAAETSIAAAAGAPPIAKDQKSYHLDALVLSPLLQQLESILLDYQQSASLTRTERLHLLEALRIIYAPDENILRFVSELLSDKDGTPLVNLDDVAQQQKLAAWVIRLMEQGVFEKLSSK